MQYLLNCCQITLRALTLFILSIVAYGEACEPVGSPFVFNTDSFGNSVAVWQDLNYQQNQFTINAATQPVSTKTWSSPTTISAIDQPSFQPIIEIAPNGNAVSMWVILDSTTYNQALVAATLPFGGQWSVPVAISDPNESVLNKSYAAILDDNGNLSAIWNSYFMALDGTIISNMRIATAQFGSAWSLPATIN